jgi:hypothetical protein
MKKGKKGKMDKMEKIEKMEKKMETRKKWKKWKKRENGQRNCSLSAYIFVPQLLFSFFFLFIHSHARSFIR